MHPPPLLTAPIQEVCVLWHKVYGMASFVTLLTSCIVPSKVLVQLNIIMVDQVVVCKLQYWRWRPGVVTTSPLSTAYHCAPCHHHPSCTASSFPTLALPGKSITYHIAWARKQNKCVKMPPLSVTVTPKALSGHISSVT